MLVNPYALAAVGGGGGGTDPSFANVVLLLHMEGNQDDQTFIDSSSLAHTMSTIGNSTGGHTYPLNDLVVAKTGTSSMKCQNGQGMLVAPRLGTEWNFGTNDFTIEAWVWADSAGAGLDRHIISRYSFATTFTFMVFVGADGKLHGYSADDLGTLVVACDAPGAFPTNQWVHVAYGRSGNTFSLYQAGSLQDTHTSSASLGTNVNNAVPIGSRSIFSLNLPWYGWIDELRVTNGVARYTSNFTPPTAPFPDS